MNPNEIGGLVRSQTVGWKKEYKSSPDGAAELSGEDWSEPVVTSNSGQVEGKQPFVKGNSGRCLPDESGDAALSMHYTVGVRKEIKVCGQGARAGLQSRSVARRTSRGCVHQKRQRSPRDALTIQTLESRRERRQARKKM
ncbi:hypothetical protein MRX96_041035 [Rhipicephalus microplus]